MDMYEITLKSNRVNRIKEKINKVNFCLMEKRLKKDLKIAMQKTIKAILISNCQYLRLSLANSEPSLKHLQMITYSKNT